MQKQVKNVRRAFTFFTVSDFIFMIVDIAKSERFRNLVFYLRPYCFYLN